MSTINEALKMLREDPSPKKLTESEEVTGLEWFKDNPEWWSKHIVTIDLPSYDRLDDFANELLFGYVPEKGYCIYNPDDDNAKFVTFSEFAKKLRSMLPREEEGNLAECVRETFDSEVFK